VKKYKIKSLCKINLSLRVLKRLNNNYHRINSFVTFCGIHDVIQVKRINKLKDKVVFSGNFKKGLDIKNNTITKTLNLLRKGSFLGKIFFKIEVKKNIPQGSGLGGGSSNAAALLHFLNIKKFLKIKKNEIYKIAKDIGTDVPICLEYKNTLLTGKSGKLRRINNKLKLIILIAYPNIKSSTKRVYQANKQFTKKTSKFNLYKDNKKVVNFLKSEKNDLEKTVIKFYPQVSNLLKLISKQNGCWFSRITGSGSACIGIFFNKKTAIYTQKLIKLKFPKYWCVLSKTI
jgi:4-diphosphocytidyl-2-C-methyl-D-erythritol kinase